MKWWLAVGLCCLCMLIFFAISHYDDNARQQSVTDEGADAVGEIRPRSAGRMASEVVLPVNEDATLADPVDGDRAELDGLSDHEPDSAGEFLDPEMFDATLSTSEKNVGMFLDVDSEPEYPVSSEVSPQQNVGTFIDADDDSVVNDELPEINIGDYLDPDGLE